MIPGDPALTTVIVQGLASSNDLGTFGSEPSNLIQLGAKKVRLASILAITLHAVSCSEGRQCLTSCPNETAGSPDWPGDRAGNPTLPWLGRRHCWPVYMLMWLGCFLFWNSHFSCEFPSPGDKGLWLSPALPASVRIHCGALPGSEVLLWVPPHTPRPQP